MTNINEIMNYYGVLQIFTRNDKYYWGIENWDGFKEYEISKELYELLLKEKGAN